MLFLINYTKGILLLFLPWRRSPVVVCLPTEIGVVSLNPTKV
jgi:hypothetical protein